ncbi:methyltransferase [Labedaea rhizosphaerae]|nr:methyltransferase [Labedaea rhizosphaerae]
MTATADDAARDRSPWAIMAPVIDLVTPLTVRAAASLRVADHLTDGPVALDELARRCDADADALARMLRHLICHGVFAEPDHGMFALNDKAEFLHSDHPSGMRVSLDLDGFGGQMDLAFTGLLHTVHTGEPAWQKVFGLPFWEYLAANPKMGASFDAMMSSATEFVMDAVSAHDWSTARHVVDVGGGRGVLLAAILGTNPSLRGTLIDLPDTVDRGRQYLAEHGVGERAEVVGQSFFDPLPTGGDVYVVSSVLHDWNDEASIAILHRCAEAAGAGGRVLVLEQHSSEGDRSAFAEMDLRMLVLAGGRERSVEEYTALVTAAGLTVTGVHTTPMGQVAIECSVGSVPASADA